MVENRRTGRSAPQPKGRTDDNADRTEPGNHRFRRRHLIAAIERILACLDGLDAEGLNWRPPAPETNSLYVLAFHSMGSAEAAIIGELGGDPSSGIAMRSSPSPAIPPRRSYARWEALGPASARR